MKLTQKLSSLAIAFTIIVAAVMAIAQPLLAPSYTNRLIAQWMPISVATEETPTPKKPLTLNQISGNFAQTWVAQASDTQTLLSLRANSQHRQSGCNCQTCLGITV